MTYYFTTIIHTTMDSAIELVKEALAEKGFGIVTEMDVQDIFKKKLDKDFRPYKILGACNPDLAYQALELNDKIGTMLPCNIIVQQADKDRVEIDIVDPLATIGGIDNQQLEILAIKVSRAMEEIIKTITYKMIEKSNTV